MRNDLYANLPASYSIIYNVLTCRHRVLGIFEEVPQDIKMPLKTLRKEASKHFYKVKVSRHATRLTSSSLLHVAVFSFRTSRL